MPKSSSSTVYFPKQLKKHGAGHVVAFEMWKETSISTRSTLRPGSLKGCNLMKQVIWNVEPSGSYAFRGHAGQGRMLLDANTNRWRSSSRDEFGTRATRIEQIEQFVMSDRTIYHLGHLRRKTLQPLERKGAIAVVRPPRVKGFPSGKGVRCGLLTTWEYRPTFDRSTRAH